jgi:N-acetylmuramoyl-L-alanine amidase
MDIDVEWVRTLHKNKGWRDVGYHYFIKRDGTVQAGRPVEMIGAHVKGWNSKSVGVCYAGGVAEDVKTPEDNRTDAQKIAMYELITELCERFHITKVCGHRDFPNVAKACPSFDVKEWLYGTEENAERNKARCMARGKGAKDI